MKIEIVLGNIVKQPDMEAVVNSANANLRLGSGVAGCQYWIGVNTCGAKSVWTSPEKPTISLGSDRRQKSGDDSLSAIAHDD